MEIFGLPVHPLVVHAAVLFAPLAAVCTIAFAGVPRWRYLTRWPSVVLAVVAGASVWVAKLSGQDLFDERFSSLPADNPLRDAIQTHQSRGDVLAWVVVALVLLVLLGAWLLGGPSGLASGRGAMPEHGGALVALALPGALVVVSVVTLVWVVLTGDAGARATWGE